MLSRRTILGSLAVAAVGLVSGAAALAASAAPGHFGRERMMKHFVTAVIDDALDEAKVTPEQRASIYASRDRAMEVIAQHRQSRQAHLEEALALFEADRVDPAQLQAMRSQREAEHRQVADAIVQAIGEVHDTLTPVQRKAVTDWVRAKRWHAMH